MTRTHSNPFSLIFSVGLAFVLALSTACGPTDPDGAGEQNYGNNPAIEPLGENTQRLEHHDYGPLLLTTLPQFEEGGSEIWPDSLHVKVEYGANQVAKFTNLKWDGRTLRCPCRRYVSNEVSITYHHDGEVELGFLTLPSSQDTLGLSNGYHAPFRLKSDLRFPSRVFRDYQTGETYDYNIVFHKRGSVGGLPTTAALLVRNRENPQVVHRVPQLRFVRTTGSCSGLYNGTSAQGTEFNVSYTCVGQPSGGLLKIGPLSGS